MKLLMTFLLLMICSFSYATEYKYEGGSPHETFESLKIAVQNQDFENFKKHFSPNNRVIAPNDFRARQVMDYFLRLLQAYQNRWVLGNFKLSFEQNDQLFYEYRYVLGLRETRHEAGVTFICQEKDGSVTGEAVPRDCQIYRMY